MSFRDMFRRARNGDALSQGLRRSDDISIQPVFSLCHATARIPKGWEDAAAAWIARADNPQLCEYILCMDRADVQSPMGGMFTSDFFSRANTKIVVNKGRQCAVDGWNTACAAATGQILITVADDWFPPEHWDTLIWKVLLSELMTGEGGRLDDDRIPSDRQRAVWVATGVNDLLMTFSILTRAYYERYGRVFHPEYIGMYADNDFQKQCERDGVLIDARKLLPVFEHRHPVNGTAQMDDIYRRQNRTEAYEVGKRIFKSRWPEVPATVPAVPAASNTAIAVLLPGETFSATFLAAWTAMLSHLISKGYTVHVSVNHTSNVYFTRQALAKSLEGIKPVPDYVLWIDDDQILTPANFDLLIEDFKREPRADIVAAWTWIQDNNAQMSFVSAGKHTGDEASVTFIPRGEIERLQREGLLVEVEWTGFPAVLMKYDVIAKASANAVLRNGVPNPFCPIPAPRSAWGFTGEDISFCVNATDAGCHIFVDARVFVPHLKLRAITPGPEAPRVIPQCPVPMPKAELHKALLEYTGV